MKQYRFFKPEEFEKATPACSIEDMNEDFLQLLDDARAICPVPFIVNSAFRTKEYEASKNRPGSSSHCKGLAIDLRCTAPRDRLKMVIALMCVGFRRFGIYPTFIHVDLDPSKPSSIWLG